MPQPITPDRDRYKSIADYAKLCERTVATIYYRIKAGTLKPVEHILPDESVQLFIDVTQYPPLREVPNGRRPTRAAG